MEKTGESDEAIRECVMGSPVLFTKEISIRGRRAKTSCETRARRQPRESRTAELEVRAARVTLRAPADSDRPLPPVSVNVVVVRELHPPEGEDPVEWILLTTLPIDALEEVRQIIQYYCVRWMIEVLFRTLKSGWMVIHRKPPTRERADTSDRWTTRLSGPRLD